MQGNVKLTEFFPFSVRDRSMADWVIFPPFSRKILQQILSPIFHGVWDPITHHPIGFSFDGADRQFDTIWNSDDPTGVDSYHLTNPFELWNSPWPISDVFNLVDLTRLSFQSQRKSFNFRNFENSGKFCLFLFLFIDK